ncbi:PREDICTED: uncharacterized protein LOC105964383 [Erythranthe guttata]|uniref:uncharacterized protein LOC105964383 n=1 Tax=Erythranthe guttata TaxID=4155 RepID=UPI00064DAC6C|nr:PREDICTED: uncharacterized protein LOC105964383 [Erythranthe guttata]|eukprot:XP_012844361.1 PREDICTED: uncharacterized protein LOC105964383 [Erythranthe guttata]
MAAMVARDSSGSVVWWRVTKITGNVRPVEGEAHAALRAIREALKNGWNSIILEGHCLQLISALQEEEQSLHSFGAFVEEIKGLGLSFSSCKFSFVKRHCNKLAHSLASLHLSDIQEGSNLPVELAMVA